VCIASNISVTVTCNSCHHRLPNF